MDQCLIEKQIDIKQQFKEKAKRVIVFYYVITFLMVVSGILSIVSSVSLKSFYYNGIQLTIIISASIIFPFIILSAYFFYTMSNSAAKVILFSFFTYLSQFIMMGFICLSLILTIFQTFCGKQLFKFIKSLLIYIFMNLFLTFLLNKGVFISHDGYYDGIYIVTKMSFSSAYPTCNQLENNEELSKLSALYLIAQFILVNACDGEQFTNCISIQSLQVVDWYSKFTTQLVACIFGAVINIIYLIMVIMMRVKLKRIREEALQNLVLIQTKQIVSSNTINNNQPFGNFIVGQGQKYLNDQAVPYPQPSYPPQVQPQFLNNNPRYQ